MKIRFLFFISLVLILLCSFSFSQDSPKDKWWWDTFYGYGTEDGPPGISAIGPGNVAVDSREDIWKRWEPKGFIPFNLSDNNQTKEDTLPLAPYTLRTSGDQVALLATITPAYTVSGAPSYLFEENLEGTGYEKGAAWGSDGEGTRTVDPDYTTTVLRGAQSLYMSCASDGYLTVTADIGGTYTELYGFMRIRFPTGITGINQNIICLSDSSRIAIWDDSETVRFTIQHGSQQDYGSTGISLNTTYYLWFYWLKGTGSDGQMWLKLDTDNTIPVSNECSLTNGDGTNSSSSIYFLLGSYTWTHSIIVDQFIINQTAIGDVTP
jgi:hypothetical protein